MTSGPEPVVAYDVARMAGVFGDRLISGDDERYTSARAMWNGMVDKHPVAIVRCGVAEDVATAIKMAREAGLPISVRGGGHQVAGAAVVEHGVVLDLSAMRGVDIDPIQGTALVGGGALLGDLDRACGRWGIAVPAGVITHTGVGGLTLGGGIGWLCRSRGLTCDSLIEAMVVNGDGEILTASGEENPDLLWALRGGGGSFGAVVRFTFASRPIGKVSYGIRTIALDAAKEALIAFGELAADLPRELQVLLKLQREGAQDDSGTPESPVVLTIEWIYSGDRSQAASMNAMMALGTPLREEVRDVYFPVIQSMQDHRFPHGFRYYLKPGHLARVGEAQADALLACAEAMPTGDPYVEILQLGGAIADVAEDAAAFPHRDAEFAFNVSARWRRAEDDPVNIDWCRGAHANLLEVGRTGAYLNFVGKDAPGLADIFGEEKLKRLRQIKKVYDPADVFRPAVHISPAAGA